MATFCISTSGTGSGADWNNAASISILGSASGGNTYYLRGGTYPGQNFSSGGTAASPVTIKRATSADHGTGTGWTSAMDTQVVFSSGCSMSGSYIVLDGNQWTPPGLPTTWGILINHADGTKGVDMQPSGANHNTLRNIDIAGPGFNVVTVEADGIHVCANALISGCKIHDCDANFFAWVGTNNFIIEYCYIYNSSSIIATPNPPSSPPPPHPDIFYCAGCWVQAILRWCVICNSVSEAFFFDTQTSSSGTLLMYGNVCFQGDSQGTTSGGWGSVLMQFKETSPQSGPIYYYHNTIVDWHKGNTLSLGRTTISPSSVIKNNLFAATGNEFPPAIMLNNGYYQFFAGNSSLPINTGTNPVMLSNNPFDQTVAAPWTYGSGNPGQPGPGTPPGTRVYNTSPPGYDPAALNYVNSFKLAAGSPAIGAADLSSLPTTMFGVAVSVNTDMNGNTGNNVGAFQTAGSGGGTTPPPATPTMIQHVSTASNTSAIDLNGVQGNPGNPFFISMPNKTGVGNALICSFSFPTKGYSTMPNTNPGNTAPAPTVTVTTPAVTDDQANTWTQIGSTLTTGSVSTAQFVALNIKVNTVKITVTFNVYVYGFQACLTEFQNVGSVDVSGKASNAGLVNSGGMTTTVAGDLIYHYGFDQSPSGNITSISPGSGFSLLSSDIFLGTFAQYQVQSAAGLINPSVSVNGASDAFNSVSVALKAATQGSPGGAGMRIIRACHMLWNRGTTTAPVTSTAQFPTQGNLTVMATTFPASIVAVTPVSDSGGSTWNLRTASSYGQVWHTSNSTPSLSNTITAKLSPGTGVPSSQTSFVFYDVVNAATSPFDTTAGVVTQMVTNSNNTPITLPTISPSTANGLVLAVMGNTYGPCTGLTNANQMFDTVAYTGQKDNDNMDNADGYAHMYNTATGSMSFTWVMNSVILSENSYAIGMAFKSASSPGPVFVNASVLIK